MGTEASASGRHSAVHWAAVGGCRSLAAGPLRNQAESLAVIAVAVISKELRVFSCRLLGWSQCFVLGSGNMKESQGSQFQAIHVDVRDGQGRGPSYLVLTPGGDHNQLRDCHDVHVEQQLCNAGWIGSREAGKGFGKCMDA